MSIQGLIRWCGLALIVGGILGALGTALQPVSTLTSSTLDSRWVPVNLLYIASNLLILFGLVGLYLRQIEKAGVLGFIAFVLTFFDTALTAGETVVTTYVFPYIARQPDAPQLISGIISPGGPLAAMVPMMQLLTVLDVGFLLLAVVVVRAGVLAPASGWLLLISSIMTMIFPLPNSAVIPGIIAQVAFSLSFSWLGYQIWSKQSTPVDELQAIAEG
jgi:hypothetical protein